MRGRLVVLTPEILRSSHLEAFIGGFPTPPSPPPVSSHLVWHLPADCLEGLAPGDLIFALRDDEHPGIVAAAEVVTTIEEGSDDPSEPSFGDQGYLATGLSVLVAVRLDAPPIVREEELSEIAWDEIGECDSEAAVALLERCRQSLAIEDAQGRSLGVVVEAAISEDQRPTFGLRQIRLGQVRFAQEVMRKWHWRCIVSQMHVRTLLEAAHLKPYALCSGTERFDPANGLPMSPTIHRAFDKKLFTIHRDGTIETSPRLSADDRRALGLPARLMAIIDEKTDFYLQHHRSSFAREHGALASR